MLVELDNLVGILNEFIGHLRDMNKSVLMNTYVNKSPEVGDVGHDARQFHTDIEVFYRVHVFIKAEFFKLFAGVKARLFEFFQNVVEVGSPTSDVTNCCKEIRFRRSWLPIRLLTVHCCSFAMTSTRA